MQDEGFTPNEFISFVFQTVVPVVAAKTNPTQYCVDNPLKNPMRDSFYHIKSFRGFPQVHQIGAMATFFLLADDGGDVAKIVADLSDPTTFDRYIARSKDYLAQAKTSDDDNANFCSAITPLLKNNLPTMADATLNIFKCPTPSM